MHRSPCMPLPGSVVFRRIMHADELVQQAATTALRFRAANEISAPSQC